MGFLDVIKNTFGSMAASEHRALVIDAGTQFELAAPQDIVLTHEDPGYLSEVRGVMESMGDPASNSIFTSSIMSGSAPRRSTRELMVAYRRLPHLRSVVNRIATSVAAVGWHVYRDTGRRRVSGERGLTASIPGADGWIGRQKSVRKAASNEDLIELSDSTPLVRLLTKWNPRMTGPEGLKLCEIWIQLKGEAFLVIERNARGVPVELWPVPPHWVREMPLGANGYRYQVQWGETCVGISEADVIHMSQLDPENPYARGSGTGETLGDELDTDEFAAKHLKSVLLNRGIPSAIVSMPGANQDQITQARTRFDERNRGPLKAGRVHWHNGGINFQRLDDSFGDMQLVDLRKFEAQIIRETFNVPPEAVGHTESSNRATALEARAILATLIVQPELEFWRTQLTEKLLSQFPDSERLCLEYDNPIPPYTQQQIEVAKAAPWAPTLNEWRALGDLEEIPEGDVHYVNGRFVPASELGSVSPVSTPQPTTTVPMTQTEPVAAAATGAVEKALGKALSIKELLELLGLDKLAQATVDVLRKVVEKFGGEMAAELGKPAAFEFQGTAVADHLAEYSGTRITGINQTTFEAIRAELVAGVEAGEGIGPLSARIRRVFAEASSYRARMIARTEVLRSSNWARMEALRGAGEDVVAAKRWLSTVDSRTRPHHRAMQGQIRPVGEPFNYPGGAKSQQPGDSGVGSEDINCRCTVVPVIKTPEEISASIADNDQVLTVSIEDEAIWRAFDRDAASYEQLMLESWRGVFAAQEHEVLMTLARLVP